MVKTENLLLVIGLGITGIMIYNKFFKPRLEPVEVEQRLSQLAKPTEKVYLGEQEPENVFYQVRNGETVTTYSFGIGDYEKLNWAQKFLLSTKIVPTKWILG